MFKEDHFRDSGARKTREILVVVVVVVIIIIIIIRDYLSCEPE